MPGEERNKTDMLGRSSRLFEKIPKFDEQIDNLDSYIRRFETIAISTDTRQELWGPQLLTLIGGKGLDACQTLTESGMKDYKTLKKTLLEFYDFTEDGYRRRYYATKPKDGQDFKVFVNDLTTTFDKWFDATGLDKTFSKLKEFLLIDRVLTLCDGQLFGFIQERQPRDLKSLTELCQRYMAAHPDKRVTCQTEQPDIVFATRNVSNIQVGQRSRPTLRQQNDGMRPRSLSTIESRRCFECGTYGHIARNCNNSRQRNRGGRGGLHQQAGYRSDYNNRAYVAVLNKGDGEVTCFTTLVGEKRALTIRDTGATLIAVRDTFVEKDQYTGTWKQVEVFGGQRYSWPVAKVIVNTPYVKGEVMAVVFKDGPYDLIIGNIHSRMPHLGKGEINKWCREEVLLMETRQQARQRQREETEAKTLISDHGIMENATDMSLEENGSVIRESHSESQMWSPEEFQEGQRSDPSLEKIFKFAKEKSVVKSKTTEHSFLIKNNTLVRKYTDTKGELIQLVAPQKYRPKILHQAHDLSVAGHLGILKTKQRIQTAFYWPNMTKDVTNYVRSCQVCMLKDKRPPRQAPLQRTDLAEKPFEKIAIDIVGPMNPMSARGHRYILTVVDLATRWPEAIPLKSTTADDITSALIMLFARTGLPDTILSDRGPQFVAELTKQITGTLGIHQVFTSPYCPQSNGVCERLNGTIKSILSKVSSEKPENWDLLLPCVLFAYREIPQTSTGFSPFELVYGAKPRGPIDILKTLVYKQNIDPDSRTTYEKVIDLRSRIVTACQAARAALEERGELVRQRVNRGRKLRPFKAGQQVRVLLPSKTNKLQLAWQGPFAVTKRISNVDYEVEIRGKRKIFHSNILSDFHLRPCELELANDNGTTESALTSGIAQIACAFLCEENDGDDVGPELPLLPREKEDWHDVKIGAAPHGVRMKILEVLESFKDILTPTPGRTTTIRHDIKLTSTKPIKLRPYDIPLHHRDAVLKEIHELLEEGIIERSDSPYSAPIIIVRKKNKDEIRLCVDYRHLNKVTVPDCEPMPNPEDLFVKLAQARIFSKLDLSRGYYQIPLTERAKPLTAFITPFGLYHWNYMSFGLSNAPSTFNKLVRRVLEGRTDVVAYLDDICLFHNSWEEHVEGIQSLLLLLRQHGLTARPSKTEVGMGEIQFLGHVVGKGQLKPVHGTVQKILELKTPTSLKEVRALIGLCNYYRKFIPNFASLLEPITSLTRTKTYGRNTDTELRTSKKLTWNDECEQALQNLRQAFQMEPILKLPDVSKPFTLFTDASSVGLGACLMQEVHGDLHPVLYSSRKLSETEKRYAVIERECLAIVWVINKFSKYLAGAPFVLHTDHAPLIALNTKKMTSAKLTRWALSLQGFTFQVVPVPGKGNVIADTLSRNV
ncbi:uncharacterized protein LOC129924728 [Biomphalaria glabrata]|uniref:Uncharacterized protein LOC106058286 n=1 Tax=Biomphalaria glabrata TaxID=6526 RepID=A0A9U8E3H0_BIOGL|nr:uncharacterized protein LOC106058286 [Biomphalaria glabrata]XP_055877210.1 uncharacterized protein LOC129924728 [Biomphalaria glabrata]